VDGVVAVTFAAGPAVTGDCFAVTHMMGEAGRTVCVAPGGLLTVSMPINGSSTGPIYLVPT